uniref:Uncharacterized protein n=1 Tax=Caenorhabditis japonica TaxID=281687 RepID=A0A8R1HVM0_CAEJA
MTNNLIRENSLVDINYEYEYESESESEPENPDDELRHRAGFEWAAPPDAFLFLGPQKIVMLAAACLVVGISLMTWIFSRYYGFTIWAILLTIIIGLIVFFPEIFCNPINLLIQFALWIAFFLFALFQFTYMSFADHDYTPSEALFLLLAIPVKLVAIIVVILVLFRIFNSQRQNR